MQVKDLENAAQEGFDSSELLKRYSTVGMGPSQGKHSNMNALRVLARARGLSVEQLGLTTSRPMYHPVPLKLLAGRSFNIERRTPIDAQHRRARRGLDAGRKLAAPRVLRAWPARAGRKASRPKSRPCARSAGLIDVGTLGKIEIYGPQAGMFPGSRVRRQVLRI